MKYFYLFIFLFLIRLLSYSNNLDYSKSYEYLEKGISEYDESNYSASILKFNLAIHYFPNNTNAYYYRAYSYYYISDYNKAFIDINKYLSLNPNEKGYELRANIYRFQKNYIKSIKDYSKQIELNTNDFNLYFDRGYDYYLIGDYSNAIQDFSIYIDNMNYIIDDVNVYYYRSFCYMNLNENNKALEDINICFDNQPQNYYHISTRGMIYLRLNDYEAALNDFNICIENGLNEFGNRGWVYLDTKLIDDAISDFNKSIKLNKSDADSFLGLTLSYFLIGDIKKAKYFYNKLLLINKKYSNFKQLTKDFYYTEYEIKVYNDFIDYINIYK